MELTLEGHPSFGVEGNVTVELPGYMHVLSEPELNVARVADDRADLVFAAGRHPHTQEIVFLTGRGELREIDTEQFSIPDGPARPAPGGRGIVLDPRGHDSIDVSVEWATRVSQLLMDFGTLADARGVRVTYVDDR